MPVLDITSKALFLGHFLGSLRRLFSPGLGPSGLEGIPMGEAEDGSPVLWPAPSQQSARHCAVLAASGGGKSIVIALALVSEFVQVGGSERA